MLTRAFADEIQSEKPHLPRAVAVGAARYAIRARCEAANGAARHSISHLYTGSAADYEKPSLVHVGTGEGRLSYGWGLYASSLPGVALPYAYRGDGDAHVYEQTFFTNRAPGDESHLLNWYEDLPHEQVEWILGQAEKDGVKLQRNLADGGYVGYDAYETLTHALGSRKAASEFLARAGFDGIKYPVSAHGGNGVENDDVTGWNYVSFRDDNITVDHKWVNGEQRHSVTASAYDAMTALANGEKNATIENAEFGNISYPLGSFGKVTPSGNIRHGLGLLHIVFARMAKEGVTLEEAVDTAIGVAEAAANGMATRDEKNRLWLDKDGTRAVIARNADGKKIITGYEIYAEEPKVTNRANFGSDKLPTPRLEDVLSALKSKMASLPKPTRDSVAYSGGGAQAENAGRRDSVTAVGGYADDLRALAHGLKDADPRAMEQAARMMAPRIPDNAVIVPMPNHGGRPVATLALANLIAGEKDGVVVVAALECEPHESNYAHKKRSGEPVAITMRRTDAEIPPNRPVVIIDNVVASGATYKAAQKVLPEADLVTLADATDGKVEFEPSLQDERKRKDAKRGPITTDRMGNLVPRHSVTAGGGGTRRQDMAVAFLAQRILAGREMKVEDAETTLRSLGLGALPAGETLARAKRIAEENRARLKKETEERSPDVFATLARANLADEMGVTLDRLITRSADATDPEVGRLVQKMAHDREARALSAAHGFTAAEMAAEMPIDLAQGLLAVKEYEKTPEEKARLEAERAKREEERRRRMEEDDRTDEEMLADAERDNLRAPTAEELAAFDALMDRARFAEETRREEERRRKLAADLKRRQGEQGGEAGDGEGDGGGDGEAAGAEALSAETVARIAPVFESPDLFAQFLVEWTSDHILKKHPELPATAQMWKSPVAVRELKQTATAILRDLARRSLGTPMHNHARNFADHLINELESDAELKTYASVRNAIARIYNVIHDDALRLTRRQLVDRLVNGWREGNTAHMGVKQLAGVKGRFSATAEAAQRAIDGRTEQWARTLVKVIYLSEAKTAQREQELEAIVNYDPTAEGAGDAPTPDAVREAADELAIIRRYGGLRRMMPGQISELSDEILDLLGGRRQAFEAERLEREARAKKVRDAFTDAVNAGRAPKPKGKKNFLVRWLEAFQGNIDLEMRSLFRHCRDEAKRQAASDAVDELMVAITEGGSRYRVEAARGREEVQRGLAAAYGSAVDGIKHLSEPLPAEVADAVFGQSRDLVPTYGHLLQLYASAIQKDYAENVKKHGRDRQIALMRATLTAGDLAFHAWAVDWYAAGRAALSDAVEAVTGVPVTSPDNCYVPVRVKRPAQGFAAEVSAWSPIPRALSKRVPHALDFDEGADFLSLVLEQVETRAQTIGYAGLGIELRDTLAHRDVQDAVRRAVGEDELRAVVDHLRDIVMADVGRDRDRTLDLLDLARGWVARFGISGNLKSVMAQPASIPVWANVMLGGKSLGLGRVAHYLAHVDRDAIAELVASDGYAARYEMGWSEEVQNILKNPSRSRVLRSVERIYDLGMKPSQFADQCATLWVAQGFYRDATQRFLDMGETEAEAKRKAMALTWAAVEATQQTGRTEYLNRAQRGRSGSIARAVFQFRTAQLLSNNYLIQALRDVHAGTPGAKGRLARALTISAVVVPAYMVAVNALWEALMGEEPPEDEERWPTLVKEMAWSMVDGVTAPLFVANTLAESTVKPALGMGSFGSGSGIPSLDNTKRLAVHLGGVAKDAALWLGSNLGPLELEEEMTLDKIMADLGRLAQDAAAPVRQAARAWKNWVGEEG